MACNLIKIGDGAMRHRAAEAMMGFLDALAITFDDCELCVRAARKFRDQALGIEGMEDMACAGWLDALSNPLPPSVAPYAHPLQRLLGRAPALYHAVHYEDGDTLIKLGEIPLISHLKLDEKWHHPEFVQNRSSMIKHIKHITTKVLRYATVKELEGVAGPDAPTPPTHEDIEAEINRFAAEQRQALPGGTEPVSAATGFVVTLQSIILMIDMHGGEEGASADMSDEELQTEWQLLMDNGDFAKMCDDRDARALRLMETSAIVSFGRATDAFGLMPADARADFWQQLNNLTSFSRLTAAMPPFMRTKVEEMAAKLTGQLSNQTMTLDDLTPQAMLEIGQSILDSTTDADIEALQSQMSMLGPAVKSMTRNNQYMQDLDKKTGGLITRMM